MGWFFSFTPTDCRSTQCEFIALTEYRPPQKRYDYNDWALRFLRLRLNWVVVGSHTPVFQRDLSVKHSKQQTLGLVAARSERATSPRNQIGASMPLAARRSKVVMKIG